MQLSGRSNAAPSSQTKRDATGRRESALRLGGGLCEPGSRSPSSPYLRTPAAFLERSLLKTCPVDTRPSGKHRCGWVKALYARVLLALRAYTSAPQQPFSNRPADVSLPDFFFFRFLFFSCAAQRARAKATWQVVVVVFIAHTARAAP